MDDASLGVRWPEDGHVNAGLERDAKLSVAEERSLVGDCPDVLILVSLREDPHRQLLDARGAFVVFAVAGQSFTVGIIMQIP